jgi:hypothetical protein
VEAGFGHDPNTTRLQRPRYPPGPPAKMEAGQGVEPRFRRSERRVLPLNEPAKTGAQRRDRTLVDRLQGGCTAIVLTGLGWSTGIEPVMTRSQRAVFTSSPRPPSNWSAARGSHPDLLFCRQVPALAGSRHELARVAGVAPTLPVLETGVLAAGRHPHTGWQPRDRTGLIPA